MFLLLLPLKVKGFFYVLLLFVFFSLLYLLVFFLSLCLLALQHAICNRSCTHQLSFFVFQFILALVMFI